MKSKKILIVDDEWEARKDCYEALERNLNTRLESEKRRVKFTFVEDWANLVDAVV